MARNENPPFERGSTYYNGGTIDSNNLQGEQHLGKEFTFEDIDLSAAGSKQARTGHYVRCRLVRNSSAGALLPKRLVTFKAGTNEQEVDGYADVTNERAFPVDEFLPTAGVPQYDIFYIVVKGPALVLTPLTASAINVITEGDILSSSTGATSGATTSGRVQSADLTGATSPLATGAFNALGRALSAKTTANTNADLLVMVGKW